KVTYWSRSRQSFWIKGETSGHTQELIDLRLDCDRDCLLALVRQVGAACHTNRRSCFYTSVDTGVEVELLSPMH
ncbi:MAG: phosphoribosyl-AMP cyclohydrolase, partial [Planktomarina sp.]